MFSQEELALIYQSVTLKDDALVQYDEVDALLSQFIINSSGKGIKHWASQTAITRSKLTIETLEQGVKYVQS